LEIWNRTLTATAFCPEIVICQAFSKRTLKSGDTDSGDKLGLFLINWHITISGQNAVLCRWRQQQHQNDRPGTATMVYEAGHRLSLPSYFHNKVLHLAPKPVLV
jgi:hypothetical protein